jgi:hypothetical protein
MRMIGDSNSQCAANRERDPCRSRSAPVLTSQTGALQVGRFRLDKFICELERQCFEAIPQWA